MHSLRVYRDLKKLRRIIGVKRLVMGIGKLEKLWLITLARDALPGRLSTSGQTYLYRIA